MFLHKIVGTFSDTFFAFIGLMVVMPFVWTLLSLICDMVCDTFYLAKRYNLDWRKLFITRRIRQEVITSFKNNCVECGKIFTPPTLVSKYCCPACSKRAYKKRQIAIEKEVQRKTLARRIPANNCYFLFWKKSGKLPNNLYKFPIFVDQSSKENLWHSLRHSYQLLN